MKKIIALFTALAAFLFLLSACYQNDSETIPNETGDITDESEEKTKVEVTRLMMPPNLDFTLSLSDVIVKGTVIDELPEVYSNPEGNLRNADGVRIPCGILYKCHLRVDEAVFGDVEPGEIITVDTMYYTGYTEAEMEKYEILDPSGEDNYRLSVGQSGYFCLNDYNFYSADPDVTDYSLVHGSYGAFDRTDEDGIYYSSVYSVDPEEFPTLKEHADEIYGETVENIYREMKNLG